MSLTGGPKTTTLVSIAEAVKLMQIISPLTQPEFVKHRGISLQSLKQVISDKGNPTVETLNKIASFYGLEVGFISIVASSKKPVNF